MPSGIYPRIGIMQEVAGKVRDICKEIVPEVFEDL